MSVYPPPTRNASIFNPSLFILSSSSEFLTGAQADYIYAQLAGGQTIAAQETFSGGILTNTIEPSSGTQVTVDSDLFYAAGYIATPFEVQGAALIATNTSTLADATATSLTCESATFTGNITANSKLFVDSNEIHSIAGTRNTTSLTGSQSSFNFTWSTGRRAMLITLVNFTSTTSPNILIYGSSGTANINLSGYTCGNNAGAQTAWGSSIPLYNTTWTSGGDINVALEIYQLNSTTYMVKGHSHRIDANYYCHYYGTIVFSNGATLSYPYITGGSMNATSVNYVQF